MQGPAQNCHIAQSLSRAAAGPGSSCSQAYGGEGGGEGGLGGDGGTLQGRRQGAAVMRRRMHLWHTCRPHKTGLPWPIGASRWTG